MKKQILFAISLFFTNIAYAQTVNNATANLLGANQNVSITQSGAGHSATVNVSGNGASFIGSQTGTTSQSYSISIDCGNACPNSPYTITQY